VLQCVAVCCSVLQCVAVSCSVLQYSLCCSVFIVLQCIHRSLYITLLILQTVFSVCCRIVAVSVFVDRFISHFSHYYWLLSLTSAWWKRECVAVCCSVCSVFVDLFIPHDPYYSFYSFYNRLLALTSAWRKKDPQDTDQSELVRACTTLQHTATHCNARQHTAIHCNTMQHTATHCTILK